jgi:hypothetical protein
MKFQFSMTRFGFVLGALVTGLAIAGEPSAPPCTSIVDKVARLACYDAANGVTIPQPSPAASGTSRAETATSSFGDNGNLRGTKKPILPKRLNATVLNAIPLGRGLFRLTLDNGQIWQTTESDWSVDFDSRIGVTITRMAFGNYLISRAGEARAVAVKRIE